MKLFKEKIKTAKLSNTFQMGENYRKKNPMPNQFHDDDLAK